MDFKTLLKRYRGDAFVPPKTLLCLDPGFTTGVCVFENGELKSCEQVTTIVESTNGTKIYWENVAELFQRVNPDVVVCENYRVYEHKLNQHANSSVDTLRLIGGIDMTCNLGITTERIMPIGLGEPIRETSVTVTKTIPIAYQMAHQAKGFVTDEKLKEWGFWQKGMRHSRDAIRHGVYYLLITSKKLGGK